MTFDPNNPLGMVPDPYSGGSFVLPETLCTDERKLWFRRTNEMIKFLGITELALKECRSQYEQRLSQRKLRADTPLKLQSPDGRSVIMPLHNFLKGCDEGVDVLCRQVFVMLYGSLETYLFELLERSFPAIGITNGILDQSLEIMMKRKWDGKFCKMREVFGLNYKANDLINHFKGFGMDFEGQVFKNPILFLDELAQIRHRIVHASSIWKHGRLIFVNAQVFHSYYAFCALLTDYVDELFARKSAILESRLIQPRHNLSLRKNKSVPIL